MKKDIREYSRGVVGIASSFLGRYREFDICVKDMIAPPGTYVEWALGVNIAKNFNDMARKMLSSNEYQWLWILGDDHVFTSDLLINLLDRDVDMITPFCLRRAEPFDTVVHECHDKGYGRIPKANFNNASGIFDVTDFTVGNAGTLIRRKVFETIPAPWFENGKSHPEVGGSDLYFCEKVRQAGFKMWLDLDNLIGHVTHAVVWPHKNENGEWGHYLACPREGEAVMVGDQKQAWIEIFNAWRANYDKIPYEKHLKIYDKIAEAFPNQNRFNSQDALNFFSNGMSHGSILEIGGWTGVLADQVLSQNPEISKWCNIEICQEAVNKSYCKKPQYEAKVLDKFLWDTEFDYTPFDILFLSHSIEHMKTTNFIGILAEIGSQEKPIKYIYIDSDLQEKTEDVNWKDYYGTHILEVGWDKLNKILSEFGYQEFNRGQKARFFKFSP